jgi:hypothetical protein
MSVNALLDLGVNQYPNVSDPALYEELMSFINAFEILNLNASEVSGNLGSIDLSISDISNQIVNINLELDGIELDINNLNLAIENKGVPIGGTAGQVLAKIDGDDYNTEWITPSDDGLPSGGVADDLLIKQSAADGDAEWGVPVYTIDGGGA